MSNKDNYISFEDIYTFTGSQLNYSKKTLIFSDFTIESGIKYKYILWQDFGDNRSIPLYPNNDSEITFEVFMDYSYLYAGNR